MAFSDGELWGRKFCVALLRACAEKKDLYRVTGVLADLLKRGLLEKSFHVATALVSMYSKCRELAKAKVLLNGLPVPNAFSWNALLAGCAQQGRGEEALTFFEHMQCKGLSPDEGTFTCVLKTCGNKKQIYWLVKKQQEVYRYTDCPLGF